ncbi:MAG: SH3 domain-containing protein, partial [Faecousia sp.]
MKKRTLCILLCLAILASFFTITVSAASLKVYTVAYDNAVYYGGIYDIAVGASGSNLNYQWQAKGSGSWVDLEDNDAYSGTTTAHLQFRPNKTFEDGGENWEGATFRCVVNGDEGKGYSPTYHMYIYSQADLLERLENDPIQITDVVHNAILPNPPEDPIAPGYYHLYAVAGEELRFDFACTSLKQWMRDTELSVSTYVQLVDETGLHQYSGADSVSFTPTKTGEKSVGVSLNMKLLIGGKELGYSDCVNYFITVKQPETIGTATVSASALNVRSGPGEDYERIGGLTKDETVSIVKQVGDWYRILYDDGVGYVLASGLNFGETTETRGKVTDISVSGIDLPEVGQNCDTDFTINGNVNVSELQWWWDKTGNGAADEENCTVFKEGGKYYCRIRLTPAEGYYFP